ncbi:hypothetical protein [Flavobacterium sp. GT3P67]|uniref:hypothetical protein n=1 Tax=Flavobacterium sp. GT3P67 TaxID=2541722 RepID=UPI001052A124|nr:hypothetical protein [Flavobacterium sp. GT3P67]TDE53791.1 hypothetical protein E0H99_07175 [Flavobacterium sp. GT3P67]
MALEINQVYKTPQGRILKVKTIRESGIHTLITIDEKGEVLPDKKNSFGHVVDRSERLCSDETIRSFKQIKTA